MDTHLMILKRSRGQVTRTKASGRGRGGIVGVESRRLQTPVGTYTSFLVCEDLETEAVVTNANM